ncbi:right-handed parallel beta-helix repeat-containing protein [Cesiribacter andamanensis]|uniref:Right handed beta helix domain-containing protein n=1 Tax=Cesiribacter andamanensis AMV16 TaxID=1279009 RepID=M7N7B0_9BACT|nr:right-handed parallel beta-helix repeat-containing protein [Cesiribacter andamanensis]EMR03152.1 hypothetical protein ADICEAN_01698 [Cesiribacter andamanensis AMV16]
MKTRLLMLAACSGLLFTTSCKDDQAPGPQTPPTEEPKETLVLGSVTTPTTLADIFSDPAIPDYRVYADIEIEALLTIAPGVVIEVAQGKRIDVAAPGMITAIGQANKKIVFRGQTAQAGFWRGISLYASTEPSVLEWVEIAHTGSSELFDGVKAAIGLFGSGSTTGKLSLKNSHLHHNAGYGVYVASGAQLHQFAGNTFSQHAEAGLYLPATEVQKLDGASIFTENAKGGIEVFTGVIEGAAEVVWPAYSYRYTSGSLSVRTGWKLSPGTTIEMGDNQYIEVTSQAGAYIHAAGTAHQKVTFSGISKQPGAWKGITIHSTHQLNLLEHAVVEYGGSAVSYGVKANVYVPYSSKLTIRNTHLAHSPGYGLYYRSSAVLNTDFETANTFEDNASGSVYRD